MKRIGKYIASVLLVSLLTIGLAACGKAENNSQSGENSDDTIISGKVDVKYTSRDLAGTWREENATKVKLSGDSYRGHGNFCDADRKAAYQWTEENFPSFYSHDDQQHGGGLQFTYCPMINLNKQTRIIQMRNSREN